MTDLDRLLSAELLEGEPLLGTCPSAESLAAWIEGQRDDAGLEGHLVRCGSCRDDLLIVSACSAQLASTPFEASRSPETRRRSRRVSGRSIVRARSTRARAYRREGITPAVGVSILAAAAVLLLMAGLLVSRRRAPAAAPVAAKPVFRVEKSELVSDAAERAWEADAADPWSETDPARELSREREDQAWADPEALDRSELEPFALEPLELAPQPEEGPSPEPPVEAEPLPQSEEALAEVSQDAPTQRTQLEPGTHVRSRGVRVRRSGRLGWTDLAEEAALHAGDKLRGSRRGGLMALSVDSRVYLAPGARLEVCSNLDLSLVRGQALLENGGLVTPVGRVDVVGEAVLAVASQQLGVRVLAGTAHVAHTAAALELSAGQGLRADPRHAQAPQQVQDPLPRWVDGVRGPRLDPKISSPSSLVAGGPASPDLGSPSGRGAGRGDASPHDDHGSHRDGRRGDGARDGGRRGGDGQRGARGAGGRGRGHGGGRPGGGGHGGGRR